MKFGTANLAINNGGSMGVEGSVEQGNGTSSVITIMAGGVLNACQKISITVGTYKLSSAASSTDTINIYGTLNVKGFLADSGLAIGSGAGTGTGIVNLYDGGLADVDAYSISRGIVKMWQGSMMRIKGNVLDQVNDDITAGKIAGQGITLHAVYMPDYNWTYVTPEPATIALLGLGGLLIRRKH